MESLAYPESFEQWRTLTRKLLLAEIPPEEILWHPPEQQSLFQGEPEFEAISKTLPTVSKAFVELARSTSCHRSGEQWSYLYSVLWRLTHGERHLLSLGSDPDLHPLRLMAKSIGRDIHKMHAFVRFRKVGESPQSGREQFVAWFEPDHFIVELASPFFRKRFASMDWSILTPDACVHWNGTQLHFTGGADRSQAPDSDARDELWKTYYRSIFNPARLKVKAMQSEMPRKYWKNLPEAEVIEELIANSSQTTRKMLETPASPETPLPKNAYLERIHRFDKES